MVSNIFKNKTGDMSNYSDVRMQTGNLVTDISSIDMSGIINTNSITYTGYSSINSKHEFNIILFGEDITIESQLLGSNDNVLISIVSLINVIGWKYYESLVLNKYDFQNRDLETILNTRYVIWKRNQKILKIIE